MATGNEVAKLSLSSNSTGAFQPKDFEDGKS